MSSDSRPDTEVKQVNRVATPLCVDKQSVDEVVRENVSRGNDDIAFSCVERVGEESKISGTDDDDVVTVSFGNGDIVARKDSGMFRWCTLLAYLRAFCTRLGSRAILAPFVM